MTDSNHGSQAPPPGLGASVGPYKLGAPLGMGGMASVFRATDRSGRTVAIKILHPATVIPEDRKRFAREFEALSKMDHPNIVQVYDTGVADNYPWIAMELVTGQDLEHAVDRWRGEPPKERLERVERVLRGLCAGLQYVHDKGLVHRDLKPTNVLLTPDDEAKISDFGVVKDPSARGTQLTKAGRLVGTVAFMAPEQITGEAVDHRADLYSLGAVLYVMLTGKRPIEAKSVAGYLARHLTEVPVPPGELDPSVPTRLERICMRLLAKDPEQRYPSAGAVLQALDRSEEDARPPVRGRDDIVARWGRMLGALDVPGTTALCLVGPNGSGKTFLMEALAEQARAKGIPVVGVDATQGALVTQLRAGLPPGDGPAVVLIDDLDHFPTEDVEALVNASRSTRRSLLALLTSTDAPSILNADPIVLDALDRNTIITMMRDRGISGPAAPVLGRRLHQDHAGLPGAVQQQLDALLDEGWLQQVGDSVQVTRPVKELRATPMPIPKAVRKAILAQQGQLDPLSRELLELLALIGRPASTSLLEKCLADPVAAARSLDDLVRRGVLARRSEDTQETLSFTQPSAAQVIRDDLDPRRRRAHHATIAQALSSRRRRDAAREVAYHLMHAGDLVNAYPMFARAARRAARAGLFLDVLDCCKRGHSIRELAEGDLPPEDRIRYRRWMYMLEGEAQLARRSWEEAIAPLEQAVDAARIEGERGALARCLGSLGRAHYRQGRFDLATPLLVEALQTADPGAPERAAATRALADIRLREGRLDEATALLEEALEVATAIGSRDSEARARRGLAHLEALRGRLGRASELLDVAEDLLKLGGDDRVRASVMARALELDAAAGRYSSALHRAEALIDLVKNHEMANRLPEAAALYAETLAATGERESALRAAGEALTYARALGPTAWEARLRVARVLCDLGAFAQAREALPDPETLPNSRVDDPPAQRAVLQARLQAAERPVDSRDLAAWALVRQPPLLQLRAASIALDASKALTHCADVDNARNAAKRGLKALTGPGCDGVRLELLLALHAAAPDPRVRDAARQVALRVADTLPPNLVASFRARPAVAEVLS